MKTSNQKPTSSFSESNFWSKLKKWVIKMGKDLVVKSLILYYVYKDPATPAYAKAVIAAALAYLVAPLDAIPDFQPMVGYSDDAVVIAQALAIVGIYVKDEHIDRAHETAARWGL